jgi:hypothetical protein
MRDIILQVRLNERERTKLGKLAQHEQVSLAEKVRLLIRDSSVPTESQSNK